MNERYAVRCLGVDPPRYEWLGAGAQEAPAAGDAAACAGALGGAPAVVLLDATAVRLLTVSIPGRSPRLLAQAIPFAVEDDLADDVEALHFAIGPAGAGDERAIAVVARNLLDRILDPLLAAGVRCESAIPETLALPCATTRWTLMIDGDRILVREGACSGFAVECAAAPWVIAKRLGETKPPGIDLHLGPGERIPDPVRAAWGDVPVREAAETTAGLARLTVRLPERPLLDLLPERARPREGRSRGRRLWVAAAVLAGLAIALHVGLTGVEVLRLDAHLSRLKADETAAFRRAFPEVQRIVGGALRLQAEQALERLRGERKPAGSFLDLLAASGQTLHARLDSGLSLRGFTYADGFLTLRLETPDVAALEQYRQALGTGVIAEVVSAESGEHGVTGTLRLRQGGG